MAKIFFSDIQSVTLNYHTPSHIYSVFRFLNSILDEPKLIRSCKVIAAHKKDNNVREGKKIVRIANPLAGSPSYRKNTESQKRWTQLVLGWFHPQALVAAHLFGKLVVGDRCGKKL